jgi:hypothetical protein
MVVLEDRTENQLKRYNICRFGFNQLATHSLLSMITQLKSWNAWRRSPTKSIPVKWDFG